MTIKTTMDDLEARAFEEQHLCKDPETCPRGHIVNDLSRNQAFLTDRYGMHYVADLPPLLVAIAHTPCQKCGELPGALIHHAANGHEHVLAVSS